MAISDVLQSLLTIGTLAKNYVATVNLTTDQNGVVLLNPDGSPQDVISQSSFLGQNRFSTGVAFQQDAGGNIIGFASVVPTSGAAPVFNPATIIGYDANSVILNSNGTYFLLSSTPLAQTYPPGSGPYPITDLGTTGAATPPFPCFVEGTRIRTARGDVAVEELTEGDQVVVQDDSGAPVTRPIVWIGQRRVTPASLRDPALARPIRIRAGAFADHMPCRDLLVSPDHAILAGGALIPARLLVNGASVVQETRLTSFRYFHIELDRHAILFSENLPTESFLDTGNRSSFVNGGPIVDICPDFSGASIPEPGSGARGLAAPESGRPISRDTHSCAPFATTHDAVRPVWERLMRRAESLGFNAPAVATTRDAAPRLRIGGRSVSPLSVAGEVYSFMVPSGVTSVGLISRSGRPCEARPWMEDRRVLGMSVRRICLRQGLSVEELALDGPGFGAGWWQAEHDGITMARWTSGDATLHLPPSSGASRILELTVGVGMTYLAEAPAAGVTNPRAAGALNARAVGGAEPIAAIA